MAEERTSVLTYAIRARVVLKYIGQLELMLAVLTLAPLCFALAERDWVLVSRYAVLCGGLFLLGGLLARMPTPARIQHNEALAITALAFMLSPLLMSWPMMGAGITFLDSLFETVSGITTTGLSTLGSIENRPATFLFTRAWMQWYGGLGIIVLSVPLLMGHHMAVRRLIIPDQTGDTVAATARTHAQHTIIVYVVLSLAGFGVVWLLTGNGFSALLHVLSAVSTGGFSSYDNSLAGLAPQPAAIVIIMISFLGAVSLPLYWQVFHVGWRNGFRAFFTDMELRALIVACLLVGAALTLLGWLQGANVDWYHGFMMGFSAQTTTGFSTLPISDMDPASKVVMIISMLIGGSVGSSAGGFKLLRLLILLRLLQLMLRRSAMPSHAVVKPFLGEQRLEDDDVIRALQLILLFVIIVILSWLPFLFLGYDPLDGLFEVVSASGTVGLSAGISRPELEPFLKGVLCFDMLAGRLEIIALLVLLYPRNWIGRKGEI
ncbi:TrkH family potassium uptake protein [Kaarinaea lacus]